MKTVLRPPPLVRPVEKSLAAVAKSINAAHLDCLAAGRNSLELAHQAGENLVAAQNQVYATRGHEWGKWLAANIHFSERTARDYMRLAREWDCLHLADAAELTLRGFLDLVAGDTQDAPQLQPWDPAPPSPDQPTVASEELTHERAQTILEKLNAAATVPIEKRSPEEQRRAIEAEKAALANRQHDREQHEHSDDRTRRLKRAGAHIAGARRDLLGLGHEADTVVADLDRVAGEIADLKEG